MDGGLQAASINGPALPITLDDAPGAIDPHPADGMDPAKVFGVPTGTSVDPSVPAASGSPLASVTPIVRQTAPPAPLAPTESASPAIGLPAQVAAPAPPTQPTVAADTVVADERDSESIPWDARIHSETRKKNADGTWRLRRNLDPATRASVYAELRDTNLARVPKAPPAPAAAPPAPTATVAPPPPATVPVQNGLSMGVPNAPNAPVVPASNFRELMTKVNQALAAGRLTQAQITQACADAQADSLTILAAQPALVPIVDSIINRILGAPAA
jgi:hypothetical protein